MELGWTLTCVALHRRRAVHGSGRTASPRAKAQTPPPWRRVSGWDCSFSTGRRLLRDFRSRANPGWLTFRRTYVFDYTANSIERRQGFVVLTGRRVESVGYARDRGIAPAAGAFGAAGDRGSADSPSRRMARDARRSSKRTRLRSRTQPEEAPSRPERRSIAYPSAVS